MNRLLLSIVLFVPLMLHAEMHAATNRMVNDFADVFTAAQEYEMEARLEAFSDSTSNQICIVTIADLEGYEAADYAQRLGQQWGVGSDKDNGVLILLKPRTPSQKYIDVFIATGYGIEGALPDALCKRIINNQMAPFLRQDTPDYYGAVEAAVSAIEPVMLGEYNDEMDYDDQPDWFLIALVLFLVFGLPLIAFFFSGGKGGHHSGGFSSGSGGGWSGGGFSSSGSGRSGGFSSGGGSSFGGFGGGSFGGGGAGGRF